LPAASGVPPFTTKELAQESMLNQSGSGKPGTMAAE
jgi:hypothetical protein